MPKLIEVKRAKEFASTFFGDPILRMAANAVLDNCPEWGREIKTNADRIRSMTDEELATIMVQCSDLDSRIGYCRELPECHALLNTEEGIPASMCEKCMVNWLQQPAEVHNG